MSIKGIPTSKELELRIKSRYSYFQLTSKDSNESKRKVIKIKEDLKAFMKSSSALLEPSDKQIISNAMRNIQILGASLLPPAFFINYKLSSQKKPWFRSLSFGMCTHLKNHGSGCADIYHILLQLPSKSTNRSVYRRQVRRKSAAVPYHTRSKDYKS